MTADGALKIREAAARLGVSIPTLRRWDRAGKLRAARHPISGARTYRAEDLEALRSGAARPSATQGDSFVGRASELRSVTRALAGGCRVVTLTGPGGIGKTTLALRVLDELRASRPAARLCDLSDVRGDRVLATLAASLDVDLPGQLVESARVDILARRLSRLGSVVLVIDNAEHVVVEVAEIIRKVRARALQARFVVTSRRALRVPGETVILVGPLSIRESTLLLERASQHGARLRLAAPRLARTLQQIAAKLEGIPLALELAAARLAAFAPDDLLAALASRLDALATARKDRPARHSTLRSAILWSYELLDAEQKDLFERLSVFRGGFGAAAASAVTGASHQTLEALREQSLVRPALAASDAPRFEMFESVREVASELLARRPRERQDAVERHAAFMEQLALAALDAPPSDVPIERLVRERENILAALEAFGARGGRRALRLAIAADYAAGPGASIRARANALSSALGRNLRAVDQSLVARARATRGRLYVEASDFTRGSRDLGRALSLSRGGVDPTLEEYVVGLVAVAHVQSGRLPEARRALALAERMASKGPGRSARALTWAHVGAVRHELDELDEAERMYTRALALARSENDDVLAARLLARLGRVYVDQRRWDDAEDALGGAIPVLTRASDRFEGWSRAHLALLRWRQGRLDAAREGYARCVALFEARGAVAFEAQHRAMLAAVLATLGRGVDASTEIERARLDSAPLRDAGLAASLALAEAHRALLEARRGGERRDRVAALVRRAVTRSRAIQAHDKDVRALAERLTDAAVAELPARAPLVVAGDGAWFTPPTRGRAELPEGSPLRAIVRVLARANGDRDVTQAELLASAWPGERIQARAASHRVHAALSELRALGLEGLLERTARGYRIAGPLRVEQGDQS